MCLSSVRAVRLSKINLAGCCYRLSGKSSGAQHSFSLPEIAVCAGLTIEHSE